MTSPLLFHHDGAAHVPLRPQSRQSAKFFLRCRNWDSPNPSPAGECAPPPSGSGGEGHTRWRERGWESPNSDEGTYTVVLFIYTYFVSVTPPYPPGPPTYRPALSAGAAHVPPRLAAASAAISFRVASSPPSPRVLRVSCSYCHCLRSCTSPAAQLATPARRPAMPPACYAAGLLCRRPAMPQVCYAAGLLCRRSAMPPACYAVSVIHSRCSQLWGGPVGDDTYRHSNIV